jgi:hypothetical protein
MPTELSLYLPQLFQFASACFSFKVLKSLH